jgi:hypothetical protein
MNSVGFHYHEAFCAMQQDIFVHCTYTGENSRLTLAAGKSSNQASSLPPLTTPER